MNDTEAKILLERIARLSDRLSKQIVSAPHALDLEFAKSDGEIPFNRRHELTYKSITIGEQWGQRWDLGWFKGTATIPDSHQGPEIVVRLDFGGEGLVFDRDGRILQGISSGSVFSGDFSRDLVHLGKLPADQNTLELWIETSACGLFGVYTEADPLPDTPTRYGHFEANVKAAELCLFDIDTWALWLDLESVRGILKELPEGSVRRARLAVAVSEAIDLYERGKSIQVCRDRLGEEYNRPASSSELTSVAVGHAHIDTAWLWPVRESIRKCARTFSSQLRLLDQYPEYVFGASQPQHYQFIKDYYPELYQRISSAVRDERWEVQGGMWVEADCNLISGESMIRQILHGKNFFHDEFGVDVKNLWLPDVFGYSAALPQILTRSGIDYFLTQKMSWNQYNKFPHHTFRWQGIDGSRVIAHFPPEDTYNSSLRAESLIRGATQFRERGFVDRFMTLFGVGDGGGGPKEEHIEFGRRCVNTEGVPKVSFGTAESYFDQVEKYRDKLAQWDGELYLELHRGTLTTQARNKRWNRKLDYALRNAEMLWSCLDLADYPSERLTDLWRRLLVNQFHDILPGSSITSVYERTEREYEQLDRDIQDLTHQAIVLLGAKAPDSLAVFNPTSYDFTGPITLPDHTERIVTVGATEFKTLSTSIAPLSDTAENSERVLENERVRYEFDSDGRLVRAFDKEIDRTVSLPEQPGNVLTLYEDRPNNWDAWDIDRSYEQTAVMTQKSISPARCISGSNGHTMKLKLRIGDSQIKQKIRLVPGTKRLDFETSVNWKESHRMLRVAFPVDVRASEASFDIQYGYIKRPTHRNTSWDLARFEVVGHRYADLSEPNYGVALLNDCKYGYKVVGNTLDLCLLRSPSYPDPDADRGAHQFTYSLLPHRGDLVHSDVIAQATALNNPPLLFPGRSFSAVEMPIRINGEGATLETLKKAEKEDCLIARIVETNGCHTKATLRFGADIKRMAECDLMEWHNCNEESVKGSSVIALSPFEIKTFKLWRD